jgi:hypothetical protein
MIRTAWRAIAVLGVSLTVACERPLECTSEITEGAGTVRASARAGVGESEAAVRRRAMTAACEKLCKEPAAAGCVARCQIDVEVGKIGGRTRCSR